MSYGSRDPHGPVVCHSSTYRLANAFFASRCSLIAWGRMVFMPGRTTLFQGDVRQRRAAHEFGLALQRMATLVTGADPALVRERQADCFAGAYLSWADGAIDTRDPVMDADIDNDDAHGSAPAGLAHRRMAEPVGAASAAADRRCNR